MHIGRPSGGMYKRIIRSHAIHDSLHCTTEMETMGYEEMVGLRFINDEGKRMVDRGLVDPSDKWLIYER